jgi:hypothetical protein
MGIAMSYFRCEELGTPEEDVAEALSEGQPRAHAPPLTPPHTFQKNVVLTSNRLHASSID